VSSEPYFASAGDYEELVSAFFARTLPKPRWTHQAHLAVGLWAVHLWPGDEALGRLRAAISAYNEAVGTANTDESGYHETVTHAYVEILAAHAARCPAEQPLVERANAVIAGPLGARDALLRFYSREVLFSVAARRAFVPPDLAPLVAAPGG